MLIITNLNALNTVFAAKAPRPIRDVLLEIYPECTIDANDRAHAPYDGYECQLTGRTFRAGEYLPMSEPDDNYRVIGVARKLPEGVDLNGVTHTWDGTRAQNIAVWGELIAQSKAYDASRSNHIGNVGDKVSLDVNVKFVKGFEGFYGVVFINILKDDSGNVIVYKGGKALGVKGNRIKVAAKVKAHDERDGVKQTVIERPKVAA